MLPANPARSRGVNRVPDFFDRYPQFYDTSRAGTRLEDGQASARLTNRYRAIITPNLFLIRERRILDIASHDGRWTLAALDAGARHVTSVEPRPELVEHADRIIGGAGFGPDRYKAVMGDIFDAFPTFTTGQFDTIFCLGFLYHTMEHFRLLKTMIDLAPQAIILDTVAFDDETPKVTLAEENPEWEGASIAVTGRKNVALRGLPTVGYIRTVVEHLGWQCQDIDWQLLGITDWRGSEIYQKRQRRTFVLHPAKGV